MNAKEIIKQLQEVQRDMPKDKPVQEIPRSELDQITGAAQGYWSKNVFTRR